MTLYPRPKPSYRRMPRAAFNQSVILKPATYPMTAQGGANAVTGGGFAYDASVQATQNEGRGSDRREAMAGILGSMPQARTRFDVLLAYEGADAVIQSLKTGDAIAWGDKTLSVLTQANDMGGFGKVWHIPCELVSP